MGGFIEDEFLPFSDLKGGEKQVSGLFAVMTKSIK